MIGKIQAVLNQTLEALGFTSSGSATVPNHSADKVTSGTLAVARGGTGLSSYTTGDIVYASGAGTLAGLAAGTSGHVLTSNGAGAAPSYQAAGGGGVSAIPISRGSKTLNDNTATTFATITLTAGQVCAGEVFYCCKVSTGGGANLVAETGSFKFAGACVTGDMDAVVETPDDSQQTSLGSAITMTTTAGTSTSAGVVNLRFTQDNDASASATFTYTIISNGEGTVASA